MAATYRLYRAARLGDGKSRATAYRSAILRYGAQRRDVWDNVSRQSTAGFYHLVLADSTIHTQIAADVDIQALSPEQATLAALQTWLDGQIGGGVSASLRSAIESDGIPIDDLTATSTRRALLRRIARCIMFAQRLFGERDADALTFARAALDATVAEVPLVARQRIAAWMQARGLDTSWITGTTPVRQVLRFILDSGAVAALSFEGLAI